MEAREIAFRFKGTRDYVHGTDIFNEMVPPSLAEGARNIQFTVHGIVRTPLCRLHRSTSNKELCQLPDIRARCRFDVSDDTQWLALTQGEGDATTGGRYEYDERQVIALCHVDNGTIAIAPRSPFTFIETVVAMNKHLHEQLFPGAPGTWLFTRIDLSESCDSRENLRLLFKQNLSYRLTRSDILVDGHKVGDVYFSLVKS